MATYFVASGGSNTAPYDTWAKAATSLQTALTAASSTGDIVVIQYNAVPSTDLEAASALTYTVSADITIMAASNGGGSAYTYQAMGVPSSGNWLGNSTLNRPPSINYSGVLRLRGLTFRCGGAGSAAMNLGVVTGGCDYFLEDPTFWMGSTSASVFLNLGSAGVAKSANFSLSNPVMYSASPSGFTTGCYCTLRIYGGGFHSTATNSNFTAGTANTGETVISGFDFSAIGSNAMFKSTQGNGFFRVIECKLGAAWSVHTYSGYKGAAGPEFMLSDCHSGDTHGIMQWLNNCGSMLSDTGIYYTSGAAAQSWKMVTSSNCSKSSPFVSPWIDLYNDGTSAIVPYIEVLRDGSTTAFKDDEVWIEVLAKTTSGSTKGTLTSSKATGTPSNLAPGAGLGSWTGESGAAWSGKVVGPSITPAEVGSIRARIVFAVPSATLYVDPQIRT